MLNNLTYRMPRLVARLAKGEDGQTLVEYALIIAFIAVALVAALVALNAALGGALTADAGLI
jgi:Flp pilus assembly pilin Flp